MSSSPSRELLELALAQRPWAGDLVNAQAVVVALDLVEAELIQRLAHIEIALADRDDADLRRATARRDDAVELIGAHERQHGVALIVMQARLHAQNGVAQADVEPAIRHHEIARYDDVEPLRVALDDRGRLDGLVHALEPDPGSAEPRHGPAIEPVVDDLLHPGGVEDRDHHIDEVEFGLMRGGR